MGPRLSPRHLNLKLGRGRTSKESREATSEAESQQLSEGSVPTRKG